MSVLRERHEEIERRFSVKHLALFGSIARDEAREDSDVDVLVEFEGSAIFDGYFGFQD